MKVWLVAALVLGSNAVFAASEQETIAALKEELAALSKRLERLEQRDTIQQQDYDALIVSRRPSGSWTDRIRIKGDFRYRHDAIDAEFSSDQNRQRIRARTVIIANVSDSVEVGFGLASGSDNPVSTNQTLGGASSSKGVRLDLAYATWTTPVQGLKLTAGKFKNPFARAGGNALLWDADFNPEGGLLSYENGALTFNAVGLWADESSSDTDSLIFGGQGVWHQPVGNTHLSVGVGYFDFTHVQGNPTLFDDDPRGNSVDANGNYVYGYQELEAFAELTFNLGNQPVTLFAQYVQNLDAGEFDSGYAIGGNLAFSSGPRPWKLEYLYQELEADAVLGIQTDSDFIGGGTDGSGHILKGTYDLTKRISLKGTLFVNERGGDLGTEEDFDRLMVDISFKY